jgi:purine-binding chemotaxis protein CheW
MEEYSMSQASERETAGGGLVELSTFYVGDALCGMNILNIQEINKLMDMTNVPQAPGYVMGILNLRGQIITILDLGKKLGLSSTEMSEKSRNIIVNSKNEYIGLLVDRIGDVITVEWSKVEAPPSNIGGVQGKFFTGVFKTEGSLIGILNPENVFREETHS